MIFHNTNAINPLNTGHLLAKRVFLWIWNLPVLKTALLPVRQAIPGLGMAQAVRNLQAVEVFCLYPIQNPFPPKKKKVNYPNSALRELPTKPPKDVSGMQQAKQFMTKDNIDATPIIPTIHLAKTNVFPHLIRKNLSLMMQDLDVKKKICSGIGQRANASPRQNRKKQPGKPVTFQCQSLHLLRPTVHSIFSNKGLKPYKLLQLLALKLVRR